MKRKFAFAAVVTCAVVLAGSRWLRATPHAQPEPQTIESRISWAGPGPMPAYLTAIPKIDESSVTFRHKLTAAGQALEGRRVKVTARCDLDAKPRSEPRDFLWRLEFLRDQSGGGMEEAWSWLYDQTLVSCKPGTHTAPEFTETVELPPNRYLARVSFVRVRWEDTADGLDLVEVPDEYTLTSFWVTVD